MTNTHAIAKMNAIANDRANINIGFWRFTGPDCTATQSTSFTNSSSSPTYMIRQPSLHCGRNAKCFVNPAVVVVHEV
jgi:hypothetical protein